MTAAELDLETARRALQAGHRTRAKFYAIRAAGAASHLAGHAAKTGDADHALRLAEACVAAASSGITYDYDECPDCGDVTRYSDAYGWEHVDADAGCFLNRAP